MKTDGETVEMITLSGHEYLYNCQMICSSNGSICWIDCHGTYLDIFICNPATRDVLLFLKAVHMMRILHLELVLALESTNIKYFGFFMQDARIKAYLINVRNTHQGVDPGNA